MDFKEIAQAGENDVGKRADRVIRHIFPSLALNMVYKEIRNSKIRINGKKTDAAYRINAGDTISVSNLLFDLLKDDVQTLLEKQVNKNIFKTDDKNQPQNRQRKEAQSLQNRLNIEKIFENTLFVAINKPAGIAVHAGSLRRGKSKNRGIVNSATVHNDHTDINSEIPKLKSMSSAGALGFPKHNPEFGIADQNEITIDKIVKEWYKEAAQNSLTFSPAPLHRLDKESSGVLFFSKSIEGARLFTMLLREKKFIKKYFAILKGRLEKSCFWEDNLSRTDTDKPAQAVTRITPLLTGKKYTLALAEITTGRHHQIRKQCSIHGFPLYGDKKYGSHNAKDAECGFFLHCSSISAADAAFEEKLGFASVCAKTPHKFMKKITELFKIDASEVEKILEQWRD